MARSIWNGVITFGMVSIPVGLSSATQDRDLHFHQIHEPCGSRIKLQKFCPKCERTVETSELVRGYPFTKDQVVILSDEDFEAVPVPSKHTIEVMAFVKAEEIDPIYYDRAYHLDPSEAGRKPYALLKRALEERGMNALAKVALRQRENLCVVRPKDGNLLLETLFFPDEIRAAETSVAENVKVEEKELKMALSLIDLLEETFDPSKYRDEYREALLERIDAKVQGKQVVDAPAEAPPKVIDLMEALRNSVELAKKKRKSG